MWRSALSLLQNTRGPYLGPGLLIGVGLLIGCTTPPATPPGQANGFRLFAPADPPPPSPAPPLNPDDNPLNLVARPTDQALPVVPARQLDVVLTVLHVQVPRDEHGHAQPLWNHLREDVFDAETTIRLRQNGLRVGVGNREWWAPVQATLDAISGVRSLALEPVRLPPNYPLALELDTEAREQTVFFVRADGTLTGETWPHSRNVLRLSYDLNLEHRERVRLAVVPEIRQRREGWEWVRVEGGLIQRPNFAGRALTAAGFLLDLEPGEFLLVAPGDQAGVFGLVGSTFLASDSDGRRYESYVFLRADVENVARRN